MPNDDATPPSSMLAMLADVPAELRAWRSVITKGWSASQSRWPLSDIKQVGWGGLHSLVNPTEIEMEDRQHGKDGPCFIPAVLAPLEPGGVMAERAKTSVRQITLLVFDLDRGSSYASVAARLQRAGVAAIVAPTYSHLNKDAAFKVMPERWEPYLAALGSPEALAKNWCAREFAPALVAGGLEGAPVVTPRRSAKGRPIIHVALRLAQPRPRWRVVVPLAAPWIPSEGPGAAAAGRWAEIYSKMTEALGLWDADPACKDASRLYYSARWPAAWPVEGPWDLLSLTAGEPRPEAGVAVFAGPLADWQALLDRHDKTTWLQRLGAAEDAERRRWEHDSAAAIAAAPALPGHAGRRRTHGRTPWLIRRPDSDVEVDLTAWHAQYGWDLMLASLVQERAPELLADRADSASGNVHIICPLSDLHGSARDDGTFVWDGCGWPPPATTSVGVRRGGMFCNHTACSGRSEGENLAVLLATGVLGWIDLDDIEQRITAAQRQAIIELPVIQDDILETTDTRVVEAGREDDSPADTNVEAAEEEATDNETESPEIPEGIENVTEAWRDLDSREEVAKWLWRLNRDYAIVGGGGPQIMQEQYNARLNSYARRFHRWDEFPHLFTPYRVCIGVDANGKRILVNPVLVWRDHPKARRYRLGLGFDPSGVVTPGMYNVWKGWGVEARQGDWSLLKGHIKEVVCRNDPAAIDYLFGWMADLVQYPDRKPGVMATLRGREGSGRGTLGHALLHIVGTHGQYVSSAERLTGRFNGFLADKILVFADEAFFPGDKKHVGIIKSFITENRQVREEKFAPAREEPDFARAISASNEDWVVPASLDSRRFFVLDVSDEHREDHTYFAAIHEQLEAGGYEAMLYDLLHHDLADFNVRKVPVTEALIEQRERSLDGEHAWLKHILARGYVWDSRLGLNDYFDRWHPKVSMALLYRSYEDFMRRRPLDRRRLSIEMLGRLLSGMGYLPAHLRNAVTGERWTSSPLDRHRYTELVKRARAHGYVFGNLDAARHAFCLTTKLVVDWGEAGGDEGDEDAGEPEAGPVLELPPVSHDDLDDV